MNTMNYNQAQQRVQDLKDFTEASYGLQSWLLSFILMIFSKKESLIFHNGTGRLF
jgi:hypothetical protein